MTYVTSLPGTNKNAKFERCCLHKNEGITLQNVWQSNLSIKESRFLPLIQQMISPYFPYFHMKKWMYPISPTSVAFSTARRSKKGTSNDATVRKDMKVNGDRAKYIVGNEKILATS